MIRPADPEQYREGVEEERRLFYVAITRAKQFCMLSYANSYRYRNGQPTTPRPSRFLKDIDGRYLNYTYGSRENHYVEPESPRPRPSISMPPRAIRTNSQSPSQKAGSTHRLSELATGMRIAHPRFGKGTVKILDTKEIGEVAIVAFDTLQDRKSVV